MAGANKDWAKKVILMKIETAEGTDAVPTAAANAFKVLNYQPTFMDAEQKVRAIEKAYFGADPVAMSAFKRGAQFDMEMAGGGAAATPPAWMTMLQIAGYAAPTVNGTTSVSISPTTDAIKAGTHYAYIDDLLLVSLGGKASVGFKIEDDEFPMFSFNYLGIPPTTLAQQAAPGAAVIAGGYVDPVLSSSEVTTFTLAGYSPGLRRWEMNTNADVQFRSLIGPKDRFNFRNRAPAGTIVFEVPDLSAKDYFANVRPGTTMAATAVQGVAAGNIVQIDTPRLQVSGNVELSEEQGKMMATMPVTALDVNGNDAMVFTTK